MAVRKNYPLRLDPKLFEILEGWAADEFRSINAHIEYLLRESVRKAGRLPPKPPPAGQGDGSSVPPPLNEPDEKTQ